MASDSFALTSLPSSSSWLWPLLLKQKPTLFDSFSSLDYRSEGRLSKPQVNALFRETLVVCSLEQKPESLNSFASFIERRWEDERKVSFEEYLAAVEEWAGANPQSADLAMRLHATIGEYEALLRDTVAASHEFRRVEAVLDLLRSHLRGYLARKEAVRSGERPTGESTNRSLVDTFEFYAKQQRLLGPAPTFDEITANNSSWSVGKFLLFCADKGLLGRQTETARKLHKDELIAIFKRTAELTKRMGIAQLEAALDEIAALFYNRDYDKIAKAGRKAEEPYRAVSDCPLSEKRKRLYHRLKLGNPDSPKRVKEEIKRQFPSLERLMRKPLRSALDLTSPKKTSKSAETKLSPNKAKPRNVLTPFRNPVQPSYSEKRIPHSSRPVPLTWASLQRMRPEDLTSERDLLDAIGDSEEADRKSVSPIPGIRAVEQRIQA